VYEALFFKKNTLFGLPLNYSQHLQTQAYLKMLSNAYFIRWDDIEGYESLPAGLSEEEGVQRAIEMGNRFSNDNHAQRMFREKVAVFLHSQSKPGIGISENSDMKFKGAEVVAKFLLNEYSPDIR
ncbi:MAG: hypothetical protein EAX95_07475, partial [Candidatus Thorarchaeota archaeon]|nr:hypothetical protein [Candidatus Thorarchaeota archaeon]